MNIDNIFKTLSISDIIQVISILISLLTSIVAIIISVLTLKQNNKMIEESSRPVIAIYSKHFQGLLYVVIKNFGASPAKIRKLTCSHSFSNEETATNESGDVFNKVQNSLLAPGSSILCPLIGSKLKADTLYFSIEYSSETKTYKEQFSLHWKSECCFPDMHTLGNNELDYLKIIANALQDNLKNKL